MESDQLHSLVSRIKERVADTMRAVDSNQWARPIRGGRPPASIDELEAAEAALGFALPPLIRALYTEVGNGGWGPGDGLFRLIGERSVVDLTCLRRTWEWKPAWPTGVIHLVNWGCFYA